MRTTYDGSSPRLSNFYWIYLREQEVIGMTDYEPLITIWVAERLHRMYGVGVTSGLDIDD